MPLSRWGHYGCAVGWQVYYCIFRAFCTLIMGLYCQIGLMMILSLPPVEKNSVLSSPNNEDKQKNRFLFGRGLHFLLFCSLFFLFFVFVFCFFKFRSNPYLVASNSAFHYLLAFLNRGNHWPYYRVYILWFSPRMLKESLNIRAYLLTFSVLENLTPKGCFSCQSSTFPSKITVFRDI